MIVNMHAAKTNLSKLVARAEAGEEVIIASAGLQRVCLTPISVPDGQRKKGDWLGSLVGQIWVASDGFEPDPQLESAMEAGSVFPVSDP